MAVDKKQLTKESGTSGTQVNSGVIVGEEYNAQLANESGLVIFDKMRRSDATVNAGLTAINLAIKSTDFNVDSRSDDDKDKEAANLAKHNLFERIDWEKFQDEALTYLPMGFAVFEMVFEPIRYDGKDYIGLKKLGFRKQTSIQKWETDSGELGVTQMVMGTTYSIPMTKLVRFTNKQEGDNYQGISILRTSYKNYYLKDKLEKIDVMGHERQGLGVLDITVPDGATKEDKAKVRAAARNLRANNQSYIEHPKDWVIQFLDMKAKTMKDVDPAINRHDRQISKNMLTQFLELGATSASGSRAVSEDHSKLFNQSVQAVADYIASVLSKTVVATLTELNFTDLEPPKVVAASVADDDIPVISEAFAKYATAGVLHPTPADENRVRQQIGMPVMAEEELTPFYEASTGSQSDAKTAKASALISDAKKLRASIEEALYESDTSRAA